MDITSNTLQTSVAQRHIPTRGIPEGSILQNHLVRLIICDRAADPYEVEVRENPNKQNNEVFTQFIPDCPYDPSTEIGENYALGEYGKRGVHTHHCLFNNNNALSPGDLKTAALMQRGEVTAVHPDPHDDSTMIGYSITPVENNGQYDPLQQAEIYNIADRIAEVEASTAEQLNMDLSNASALVKGLNNCKHEELKQADQEGVLRYHYFSFPKERPQTFI